MKIFYLISLLCFLVACDASQQEPVSAVDAAAAADATPRSDATPPTAQQLPKPSSIEVGILQDFNPAQGKVLRRNEYGAGDCWGSITEYALPKGSLAIDSMTCGEYGFTYTRYLFNANKQLIAVRVKKSDTLFGDNDEAAFSRVERLVDFSRSPAKVQIKTDTIKDYALREAPLQQAFQAGELPNRKEAYTRWEQSYKEAWTSN